MSINIDGPMVQVCDSRDVGACNFCNHGFIHRVWVLRGGGIELRLCDNCRSQLRQELAKPGVTLCSAKSAIETLQK